jgi:hypothetical protein
VYKSNYWFSICSCVISVINSFGELPGDHQAAKATPVNLVSCFSPTPKMILNVALFQLFIYTLPGQSMKIFLSTIGCPNSQINHVQIYISNTFHENHFKKNPFASNGKEAN